MIWCGLWGGRSMTQSSSVCVLPSRHAFTAVWLRSIEATANQMLSRWWCMVDENLTVPFSVNNFINFDKIFSTTGWNVADEASANSRSIKFLRPDTPVGTTTYKLDGQPTPSVCMHECYTKGLNAQEYPLNLQLKYYWWVISIHLLILKTVPPLQATKTGELL